MQKTTLQKPSGKKNLEDKCESFSGAQIGQETIGLIGSSAESAVGSDCWKYIRSIPAWGSAGASVFLCSSTSGLIDTRHGRSTLQGLSHHPSASVLHCSRATSHSALSQRLPFKMAWLWAAAYTSIISLGGFGAVAYARSRLREGHGSEQVKAD